MCSDTLTSSTVYPEFFAGVNLTNPTERAISLCKGFHRIALTPFNRNFKDLSDSKRFSLSRKECITRVVSLVSFTEFAIFDWIHFLRKSVQASVQKNEDFKYVQTNLLKSISSDTDKEVVTSKLPTSLLSFIEVLKMVEQTEVLRFWLNSPHQFGKKYPNTQEPRGKVESNRIIRSIVSIFLRVIKNKKSIFNGGVVLG